MPCPGNLAIYKLMYVDGHNLDGSTLCWKASKIANLRTFKNRSHNNFVTRFNNVLVGDPQIAKYLVKAIDDWLERLSSGSLTWVERDILPI